MDEGCVIKISGLKTVQVNVIEFSRHSLYGKVIKKVKKFACQVENIELKNGDKVLIDTCKPYSKTKKHIVVKKLDV